jgi:two-component system, OmpR family, sensor histidine kinase CiaH
MANLYKQKRLEIITIVYWFLLVYILAALVWWFIALWQQNLQMTNYRLNDLQTGDPLYKAKEKLIKEERKRKETQYIGEGATFMLLILIGAVFVYRAVRKQIKLTAQQQNFMMAITHELKTPIAVARLNLETLKKRRLEETQQDKLIQNTLQETNRLNDLCNNILLVSQMESGGYSTTKEECNWSELTRNTVDDFRSRFPGRTIEAEIEDNIRLFADRLLLQLAMNNLIENALKYSPKEKTVKLRLVSGNKTHVFEVRDEGTGIADTEKSKVFDKFYRVGAENTRQTKGTGLGLYLSKKIINDHKGDIAVVNNIPSGSIFIISLPAL